MLLEIGQQIQEIALRAIAFALGGGEGKVYQDVRQALARAGHQLQLRFVFVGVEQLHFDVDAQALTPVIGEVVIVVIGNGGNGWRADGDCDVGTIFDDRESAKFVQQVAFRQTGRGPGTAREER